MCAPGGKGLRPARAQPRPCINIDIFFPLDTELPSTSPDSGRLQLPQRLSKAGTESAPPPGVRNNCAFPSAGGPGKLRPTRPTPARRHLYQKRPPPSLPTTRKPRGGVLRRGGPWPGHGDRGSQRARGMDVYPGTAPRRDPGLRSGSYGAAFRAKRQWSPPTGGAAPGGCGEEGAVHGDACAFHSGQAA